MAAVDTPPGIGLPGAAVGWFRANPAARRLATRGFLYVVAVGVAGIWLTAKRWPPGQGAERLVVVVTAVMVAAVALAVRRARVGIASDGVRWGWGAITVRMDPGRIVRAQLYRDAIALVPRRGSTWFLSRRDWDRFEAMRRAAHASGLPVEEHDRPAPWRARLQSYGRVLDGLVFASGLAVTLVAIAAL